jgi:hypothetical protein
LTAACGGDDDDDSADVDGGGSDIDASGGGDIDAAMVGDGNDSFADAQTLGIDDPLGVNGAIQEPADRDFFKFDATAGDWLKIVTVANAMDDLEMIDTVIKLYDSSMTQIAENDDAVPRINTDSEVIIRLPSTGTYYVEILEWSDWASQQPFEGDPTFTYQLLATTVNPAGLGVLEDPENGDDAGSAEPVKFDMGGGLVIGDFNDATDVDVFEVSLGVATGPLTFSSAIAPDGTDGYGSTAPAGEVYLTNAAGTQILARIDATKGPFELSPPVVQNTTYQVWITRPAGATPGANDFYVYKFCTFQGNPKEAETAAGQNDTTGTAEAMTEQAGSYFIRADLTTDTDLDYFSFTATAGQKISVACAAARVGSGAIGMRAEVRDAADAVLASQNESLAASLFIEDVDATAGGTYYLRLSKTGQDAEVSGNFVRCGVHKQ